MSDFCPCHVPMYQLYNHVNIRTLTGANNVLKTAGKTQAKWQL